ncbi:MAG: BatA and WFA domain-containing protein [Pirellulales bacterium]|nr:BatA and WFA domain-containing protein [Pirellulales bacterium]
MTFVNISLLAGTALIAVPIVLHLIMRRKPQWFEFPALRFLQRRHDANRRQLRLRHLLLLLLRALAILLLAWALARPSVQFGGSFGSQEAPVAAALVFDTAPRMEYRHENQTRLQAAQDLGLWLIAQLPRESEIAVLDTRSGGGVMQVDRGAARRSIDRLEIVPNAQPLPDAVGEALRLLKENQLPRKELYVFTDLSRGAWPAGRAADLQRRLDEVPGAGVYLIDVGVTDPVDYALGELRLSADVLSTRSTLTIETDISSLGGRGERAVELILLGEDGQEQKSGDRSVTLQPGNARQVEFRLTALDLGVHQGFLRIVGQDGLAADDVRYFSAEVQPPWRVLIAAPPPAGQYALFLREALAPELYRKRGQARFECTIVGLDKLAKTPLAQYAAVFVLDPHKLTPAVWQKLTDYAADGHGVGIFLGRNALPVDPFNEPQAQELLPGKLLRQVPRPDGDLHLSPRDLTHPILAEFRKQDPAPWDLFPVLRYWELDRLHSGASVVLRYSDGRPAVLERPLGNGRSLTMTTPVSDRPQHNPWNFLPVGDNAWPFMILVNQMATYLVGSTGQQLNYYAGQTAVVPLGADVPRPSYLLSGPGEISFTVTPDPERRCLVITATDRPGNYRVRAGGQNDRFDRGLSVNLAPEQTELDRISEQELAQRFGPRKFRLAKTRDQIDRQVSTARVGRELFTPLILALAVALAFESVLANRFYREG